LWPATFLYQLKPTPLLRGDGNSFKALPNQRVIRLNFLSKKFFLRIHLLLYPKDPSFGSIFKFFEVNYHSFDKRIE